MFYAHQLINSSELIGTRLTSDHYAHNETMKIPLSHSLLPIFRLDMTGSN